MGPDRYSLVFDGLPDGCYVKSILWTGVQLAMPDLDLTATSPTPVEIVLSPNAGQAAGAVQDEKTQQPAPGAIVVLVPQEKERRDRESFYKSTTADQSGQFTLKNLVPGEYKAFAWEEMESGAYMDPDFLQPFDSKGVPVTISERGRPSLQLTLLRVDPNR